MNADRNLEPRGERSAAPGRIEVWYGADRVWRYRYVHSPGGTIIEANRSYVTRQEAVDSARIAYPGVPAVELRTPPEGEPPRRSSLRRLARKAGIFATLALTLRAAVKLVLWARRLSRKARKAAGIAHLLTSLARSASPPPSEDDRPSSR